MVIYDLIKKPQVFTLKQKISLKIKHQLIDFLLIQSFYFDFNVFLMQKKCRSHYQNQSCLHWKHTYKFIKLHLKPLYVEPH